jgi:hypothetical protein
LQIRIKYGETQLEALDCHSLKKSSVHQKIIRSYQILAISYFIPMS